MPWTVDDVPSAASKLPAAAKKIFVSAANSALDDGKDDAAAIRIGLAAVKNAGYEKDDDGNWKKIEKQYAGSYEDICNQVRAAVQKAKNKFCACYANKDWGPYTEATWDGGVLVKCYECGGLWLALWSYDENGEIQIGDVESASNIVLTESGKLIKELLAKAGRKKSALQRFAESILKFIGVTQEEENTGKADLEDLIMLNKAAGQRYMLWEENGETSLLDLDKLPGDVVAKEKDEEPEKLFSTPILKADAEKQIVYGVVYEPDVPDAQGDMMSAAEIEKMAHQYLMKFRLINKGHKVDVDAVPVESYIAPASFTMGGKKVKKGSWVLATKIADAKVWKEIKDGDLTGYSMEGYGIREKVVA